MKANRMNGPTPFTGHRVTLEVVIPRGWTEPKQTAGSGADILEEIERRYPEMRLVMLRDYLNGVDYGGIIYEEYELVSDAQSGEEFSVSAEALDEAVWEVSFRDSAMKHYVKHLNEVAIEAADRADNYPNGEVN